MESDRRSRSVSTRTTLPARRTAVIVASRTVGTNPGGATRSSTQAAVIVPTDRHRDRRRARSRLPSPSGTTPYRSDLLALARKRSSGPASWSPLMRNASCPCGESISKYSATPPTVGSSRRSAAAGTPGTACRSRCRRPASGHRTRDMACSNAPAPAGDVVEVHRLGDREVAVGVEPPGQLRAVVLEVPLDLEALPHVERVADLGGVGELTAEPVGEHVVAAERHLRDHPRHLESLVRALARRRVVVVAATPCRIETNRPPTDRAPRDLLRRGLHAGGDRHERAHPTGIHDRPLERLHATHRPTDHRQPTGDPEMFGESRLGADHVTDRHDREA